MTKWADDWVAEGKPRTKVWTPKGYRYEITGYGCSAVAERSISAEDREDFYALKPGCRAQFDRTQGLTYRPDLGGFAGGGVAPGIALPGPPLPPPAPVARMNDVEPWGSDFTDYSAGVSIAGKVARPSAVGARVTGGSMSRPIGDISSISAFTRAVSQPRTTNMTLLGFNPGFAPGGTQIGNMGTTVASGGWLDTLRRGIEGYQQGGLVGAGQSLLGITQGGCPSGTTMVNGQCQQNAPGPSGWLERTLPGGSTGTLPATAVQGHIGARPPQYPMQATVNRCPTGMVMGKDGLCYEKGQIPRKYRKRVVRKAPFTAADADAVRKAARAKDRLVKLTKNAGAYAALNKPKTSRRTSARRQIGPAQIPEANWTIIDT